MGKKWERFKHLDEEEYWAEVCTMDEQRLRLEHKLLQQNILSASTAAGASGAAGFVSGGAAWVATAVAARRLNVNMRQRVMVEKRLQEMEWSGHKLRKRDVAYAAGPCCAVEALIPAGGALLGHAGQAFTHQAVSTASQHAAIAASQHAAHASVQHVAQDLAVHHPADAMSTVISHGSTFAHAAAQSAENQLYVATHGFIGHAGEAMQAMPTDALTAQATVLGSEAGYVAAATFTEGARVATHMGIKQGTRLCIGKVIRDQDLRKSKSMTNINEGAGVNSTEAPRAEKMSEPHANTCQSYVLLRQDSSGKVLVMPSVEGSDTKFGSDEVQDTGQEHENNTSMTTAPDGDSLPPYSELPENYSSAAPGARDASQGVQFCLTVSEVDDDNKVVTTLVDMGFSKLAAQTALMRTQNDLNSAVEILIGRKLMNSAISTTDT